MSNIQHHNREFFKNLGPFSLKKIAEHLNASIYQNAQKFDSLTKEITIHSIKTLKNATKQDISFFSHRKYLEDFSATQAVACIADEKFILKAPKNIFILVTDNSKLAYAKILQLFYGATQTSNYSEGTSYIDPSAKTGKSSKIGYGSYIGKDVILGNNVQIHPNAYIGDNVIIGDNCVIHNSTSITNAIIGNNTIIHTGTRIGQDGFGYATISGTHMKIPQIGRVVIGNDVEIGANSTIDRGSLEDTVIGDMCKLDNLVQIGHNVTLGKGCIIVSQVGISGSTKIGNYSVLGGQVGVADNVTIGDFVQIAAKSGIMKNINSGEIVMGAPAQPIKQFFRQLTAIKKLSKTKE
jgi:UDP-3-O-[3-hydroxymyristoyl] glucosamine N-acyltransferase